MWCLCLWLGHIWYACPVPCFVLRPLVPSPFLPLPALKHRQYPGVDLGTQEKDRESLPLLRV